MALGGFTRWGAGDDIAGQHPGYHPADGTNQQRKAGAVETGGREQGSDLGHSAGAFSRDGHAEGDDDDRDTGGIGRAGEEHAERQAPSVAVHYLAEGAWHVPAGAACPPGHFEPEFERVTR